MLTSSVLAASVAVWLALVPQSSTVGSADGSVTWSASPADQNGADGRSWVDLDVDPGASVQEHIAVFNYTDEPLALKLETADGYFTENGRFNMQPSSATPSGAGMWLDAPETITVPPREQAVVPYRIDVPASASPGDYLAGIAATLTTVSADHEGLSVASRVGFRVMIRVSGELDSRLSVDATAQYSPSWNPFQPGRLEVATTVRNTGNTRLLLEQSMGVSSALVGSRESMVEGAGEIAPGETRVLTTGVSGVWPTFWVTVDSAVTGSNAAKIDTPDAVAVDSAVVMTVPWSQIALVLAVLVLVWTWILRRRRRTARQVNRAEPRCLL